MNNTLPDIHGNTIKRYLDARNKEVTAVETMLATLRGIGQKPLAAWLEGHDIKNIYPIGTYKKDEEVFVSADAIKVIDKEYWYKTLKTAGILDILPAKEKEQWEKALEKNDFPPFTTDAVYASFEDYYAKSGTFLAQKADSIFRALSGAHVTNTPEGFGVRFILQAFDSGPIPGITTYVERRLADFFDVVLTLVKRPITDKWQAIRMLTALPPDGEWYYLAGNTLRARRYKKGTVHFSVHPDLSWQMNKLLATLYPKAIPPRFRTKPKKTPNVPSLKMHWLQPHTCDYLQLMLRRQRGFGADAFYMADSWGSKETQTVLHAIGGFGSRKSDGFIKWQFDYDAWEAITTIMLSGYVPDDKSWQYYPTPHELAQQVVDLAEIGGTDSVLEPSAGIGNIADLVGKEQCQCVELSALRAKVLQEKGYKVFQQNFLDLPVSHRYDRIVMNPPFTGGQAKAHVEHALAFLKPHGKLVAIVPAGFKADWISHHCALSETIDNAFKYTSIGVRILEVRK